MDPYQLTLTPKQAAYLQNYLPTSYSFQTSSLQSKRQRAVKKIDDLFTSEFTLLPLKKIAVQGKNSLNSSSQKAAESFSVQKSLTEIKIDNQVKTVNKQIAKQSEVNNKKPENCLTQKMLRILKNSKHSWPFRSPVVPTFEELSKHSYNIKQRMNLKTVEDKYKAGGYRSYVDFDEDIRKIISDSYQLNGPDTNLYEVTVEFQNVYLDAVKLNCKQSQTKLKSVAKSKESQNSQKQLRVDNFIQKVNKVKIKEDKAQIKNNQLSTGANQRMNGTEPSSLVQKSPMKQLNFRERQKIFNKIDKLSQQNLRSFIKLCGVKTGNDWTETEIDLADLSEQEFKKIEIFLQEH